MTSITDRISGPTNFGATLPMSRSPFIYNNASVIDSSVREFTNSSTVMRQTSFNKGAGNIIGGATRFNSNPLANSPVDLAQMRPLLHLKIGNLSPSFLLVTVTPISTSLLVKTTLERLAGL